MTMLRCQGCGRELSRGGLKYIIEVKSFADFDGYIEEYPGDVEDGIHELLDAIENVDPKTLEEDVYMERTYILCKSCRDRFSDDPFHTGESVPEGEVSKGTVH
ncbi:MAG: hypothetical protein HY890_05480 [Deltaproteobacteria bacterium]|nr:hypothetical protein [Deltaproteobacteria bacterium]